MEEPVKQATARDSSADPLAEKVELNAEQRELVRRLEISWAQAERGEVIPFEDVLRELRLEREAAFAKGEANL